MYLSFSLFTPPFNNFAGFPTTTESGGYNFYDYSTSTNNSSFPDCYITNNTYIRTNCNIILDYRGIFCSIKSFCTYSGILSGRNIISYNCTRTYNRSMGRIKTSKPSPICVNSGISHPNIYSV